MKHRSLVRRLRRGLCEVPVITRLVVLGLLLIAVIVIGATVTALKFQERALRQSERELESTARLLSSQLDHHLRYLDVVQKDLTARIAASGVETPEEFRNQMSGPAVYRELRAKMDALPNSGSLTVYDGDGKLINSSIVWPPPEIAISDRNYFRTMKTGEGPPAVIIESVEGRISGKPTIVIARRVVSDRGEFLGVVDRAIEPWIFADFLASVELGPWTSIAISQNDGTFLASHPKSDSAGGAAGENALLALRDVLRLKHYSGFLPCPMTDAKCLVSSRELRNFPIHVVTMTSLSAVFQHWRDDIRPVVMIAALSALAVAVLLIAVIRKLLDQHRVSRELLTLEKERLQRAVNNMAQGLVLFDASEHLVICNRQFIDLYGLSAEVVKPGASFVDILRHGKAAGSMKIDIDEYRASVQRERHRHQVVVTGLLDGRSIQVSREPFSDGGWVATHEDVTERRRTEERISHLAHFDALTDLPNRTQLEEHLGRKLVERAPGERIAVFLIDVDEFKNINDTLGHFVGDELLKAVAAILKSCAGNGEMVARLGGDEFAVVQSGVQSVEAVTSLVEEIFDAIREPVDCLGHRIRVDASIGIALAPQDGSVLEELLKNADLAMYAAKAAGRRTYRFFEPCMVARVQERRQLEIDLRRAHTNGELMVWYQPCYSLKDSSITGCEALLRWHHPRRGPVPPSEFVALAEETGLIGEIGEWVLQTACSEAALWPENIRLSVNVSPAQFGSPALALRLMSVLSRAKLPASRLEIEITEAVLISDDEEALALLHQLRDIGVSIALDDFGTGYSSLSYLRCFPFDRIKIDRSFVRDIASCEASSSIVQAVVNIAQARRMTTTAEGVETEEQRRLLRALGCTEVQGWLFGSAMPAEEIRRLLFDVRSAGAGAGTGPVRA
ncbi:MAG: EAL domain-containing protein [Alphaproteobacteria bacterium]|nr:EAL domain-containing protein [Alphaproteobacteria bacterium]